MQEIYGSDSDEMRYLEKDLVQCRLCEWGCGCNRLEGEIGVCGIGIPEVSSSRLHPAPPASFDAFLTGCSFRCISCQNWPVANYPANKFNEIIEGYYSPAGWAELATAAISSTEAKAINADRLFFTGGEPGCSLPWVEAVVKSARKLVPGTKVNFDTNGYMTRSSLMRILEVSDSITFDIKAYDEKIFRSITGADVGPVLRNAEYIAVNAPGKIWEFRILVIPRLNETDIEDICRFLSDIDQDIPVNFLSFRPNFVMEEHIWTPRRVMEECIQKAKAAGLTNVTFSGRTRGGGRVSQTDSGIPIEGHDHAGSVKLNENAALAMGYARAKGCIQRTCRSCGDCSAVNKCRLKLFEASRLN